MIVIADTSALNYLTRMDKVEILQTLYGRVIIPTAVHDEMKAPGAPAVVRSWAVDLPNWIEVVSAMRLDSTLPDQLGDGEREAISLAMETAADIVLMDDQPGRVAAEQRGLFVSGTLSVVLDASRVGLLDFDESLAELKRLGFRMSEAIEIKMKRLSKPV